MTPMILAILLAAAPAGERPRVPPVDQCASESGFAAYREALRAAVARQDVAGLLALTDDKILLNFGGDTGHAELGKQWSLDQPSQSELWSRLDEVLGLGCAKSEGGALVVPAMAQTLPEDVDVFDVVVATMPGATLRAAPDESAATVATLDWDLLTAEQWEQDSGWVKARMADGRSGYVRAEAVRSPIDYRATFEKIGGAWKMTAFVAGD